MEKKEKQFKDAIFCIEVTRTKEGDYFLWSHSLVDKHKGLDNVDYDILQELHKISIGVSKYFFTYGDDNKIDRIKGYDKGDLEKYYPKASKISPTGKISEGNSMKTYPEKEFKKRFFNDKQTTK